MSPLEAYRDDGPLAARLAAGLRRGRPAHAEPGRLAWLVPPLVRVLEYGFLIWLTATAAPDAMPRCFALLGVLAFHHYDTVYRLRHQRVAPPAWVRAIGGGWEGRVALAALAAVLGALGAALLVAAIVLAAVYVTESVLSWARFARTERPAAYEEDDEEVPEP